MPDLTEHAAWTCDSNIEWEIQWKPGGGTSYTIRFSRLIGRDAEIQGTEFGWTCTCKGFKYRATCKHTAQAETARCGWNGDLDPGVTPNMGSDGHRFCPKCGSTVTRYQVAV